MRINRRVSHAQIKRRILRKVSIIYPDVEFRFLTKLTYPVKHTFFAAGVRTSFTWTYETVLELLQHSKLNVDPYGFVIDAMYYTALKEIKEVLGE